MKKRFILNYASRVLENEPKYNIYSNVNNYEIPISINKRKFAQNFDEIKANFHLRYNFNKGQFKIDVTFI